MGNKNRRPDDWACHQCKGNEWNFADRCDCFKCHTARPKNAALWKNTTTGKAAAGGAGGGAGTGGGNGAGGKAAARAEAKFVADVWLPLPVFGIKPFKDMPSYCTHHLAVYDEAYNTITAELVREGLDPSTFPRTFRGGFGRDFCEG